MFFPNPVINLQDLNILSLTLKILHFCVCQLREDEHMCLHNLSTDSSGEGNGNPLQYSCFVNPLNRGAWRATVHGVAKSRPRLSMSHHVVQSSTFRRLVCQFFILLMADAIDKRWKMKENKGKEKKVIF